MGTIVEIESRAQGGTFVPSEECARTTCDAQKGSRALMAALWHVVIVAAAFCTDFTRQLLGSTLEAPTKKYSTTLR